ncbi:MAG: hypothetical protein JSV05_09085 [Candidatus Bathyarchaeota archaeon]|nr:MAG: hypothetical protein JSV05_09085 [Candidatus Bathyarchaeota archaeon]
MIITCDQGTLHWVEIGQPSYDFTLGKAFDENNNELTIEDSSSQGNYKVRIDVIDLHAPNSVRFNLTTNVGHMIWEDTFNPGNVGMNFTPSWFPVTIENLRVKIILPSGVTEQNLKTLTGVEWDNADYENDNFWVYWERDYLAPNAQYAFGVSFPKEFVDHYEIQENFLQKYGLWLGILAILGLIVTLVVFGLRKSAYSKPIISVEALGIRRGLTAVEASYLLDLNPNMIVTEILYSLLKKRVVWVTATKPSVKLEILKPYKDKSFAEFAGKPLRYYEIDFLNAMKKDGSLDEELLAETILFLRGTVEEKLRGYCRRDTINYYTKIVEKAWEQVKQAGTSELASEAYNEQLLWLLLDPEHRSKTEKAFEERVFEPTSLWFWYWYGYQHYHPRPRYEPNIKSPDKAGPPPKILGADLADNIATAIENTSNNIVVNIEKFANAILPPPQASQASHEPAQHTVKCVCACAACACACACVSCACACAGGGAG